MEGVGERRPKVSKGLKYGQYRKNRRGRADLEVVGLIKELQELMKSGSAAHEA